MTQCNECKYRWKMYSSQKDAYCGYFPDTGMLRNANSEYGSCDSFVLGNPERKSRIIFSANYFKM